VQDPVVWLIGTASVEADTMPSDAGSAAGSVISVIPIIAPISQLAIALGREKPFDGSLCPGFTTPVEIAERFLGVVEEWAADPNRPRSVYADLTDPNGSTARVTLELGSWSSQS